MSLMLAVLVAWLFATGTYLLLSRTLTRIILGVGLLGHGAVLLLQVDGGRAGTVPIVGAEGPEPGLAAPLPQALALTAIVIGFAATAFLLAMAYRSFVTTDADEVEDDIEDAHIARLAADAEGHDDRFGARDVPDREDPVHR